MWDERFAEVCRRHPDLVAVYESSRGRLGLLLRQTLVPLSAEQVMWVNETRTRARAAIHDLRAAGFEGGTLVLQWLPIEDVARIVARWVRRWDGDAARRSAAAGGRRPPAHRSTLSGRPAAAGSPPGDDRGRCCVARVHARSKRVQRSRAGFTQGLVRDDGAVLARHPTGPAPSSRLANARVAGRPWRCPIRSTGRAGPLTELGPHGSLARALERLVPAGEAAAWRRWIDHVREDLARALGRPPAQRTQAWARWLFFIPYSIPVPRRRPSPRSAPPASAWTPKPWREKMNA